MLHKNRHIFTLDGNDNGLRGHSKNIYKPRFNTDIRKYLFSNRVTGMEQFGPGHCRCTQPKLFQKKLNKIRRTTMGFFPPCHVG